jgi:hypothetical protein
MIKNKTYSLNSQLLLTSEVISSYVALFWQDIFMSIAESGNKHLMIICKIKYSDSDNNEYGYKTLGTLRRVEFKDMNLFINYLEERIGILNDSYNPLNVDKIVFTYIIKEGLVQEKDRALLQILPYGENDNVSSHRFNNIKLPISMNPYDYGTVFTKPAEYDTFTRYIVTNNKRLYQIDVSLDKMINNVSILGLSDFNWKDTKLNEGIENYFMREVNKSTIYFLNGEAILRKQELNAKPFRKTQLDKSLLTKFITFDIETIIQNKKLEPYLICAYDGQNMIQSYTSSSGGKINQELLFSNFINQLVKLLGKDSKLICYAHNFSGFDGIFILKHLVNYGKVEPLLFNGKLISIKVKLNIEGYIDKTIIFKDSYLLLPTGLKGLCKQFNILDPKGWFPIKFNSVLYKGALPAFEAWNITIEEYETLIKKYTGKVWNFKEEALKYCKLDCKCLHEILTQFNKLMFNNFKLNVHNVLTLPALAMKIYKSNFMPDNSLYQLHGKIEREIRKSYTGGAVDVYIPSNKIGSFFSKLYRKLYYYDVNSLYPYVMLNNPMPIGLPIAFKGYILLDNSNAFGFFYCKITSPKYLEHPILQRSIKIKGEIRTIAGLGTWYGWIFSEEMYNAIKYGYQFEIIKGYEFNKGNTFSNFINEMYDLRLKYSKGDAMNTSAKLLMNSLYGKFGMLSETTKIEILDNTINLNKLLDNIIDIIYLENHIVLTYYNNKFIPNDNTKDLFIDEVFHQLDVNIAIASAISAYARIFIKLTTLTRNES